MAEILAINSIAHANDLAETGDLKGLAWIDGHHYHGSAGLSSTPIRAHLSRSPAHYQEYLRNPPKPTAAMVLGSAVHAAVLEPAVFERDYGFLPEVDRRTKEGKAIYSKWLVDNMGKTPLDADDQVLIAGCREALFNHSRFGAMMQNARLELAAYAMSPMGVLLKAKADVERGLDDEPLIIDVKTTEDADEDEFSRDITNMKYHWQAALYLDVFSRATGRPYKKFLWAVVEKSPPHRVEIYIADEICLEQGRKGYMKQVERFAQCQADKSWPASDGRIKPISIKPWGIKW